MVFRHIGETVASRSSTVVMNDIGRPSVVLSVKLNGQIIPMWDCPTHATLNQL